MYSGDDRRDAKDGDINEEDYNSDALYGVEDDSESDDDAGYGLLDCDSDDSDQVLGSRLQEKYTILKGDARQEDYMTRVYSAQFDSEHPAFKRFCRNFADEDEVCKAVGRLDISSTNTKTAQGGKIKRCPAPGCDCAIQLHDSSGGYDVTCFCSYSFCWNCTEEAHRPVDCETVSKWKMERSRGSEDMKLILADAKACPKCKSPIEKRQGCMHMTCKPPCKYDFCWVCLGEWSDHTRDLYACNRYETAKQEGAYRRRRETRYAHYYERWATHESSRQKAVSDLQAVDLAGLSEKTCECDAELEAILEAWLQVVECRRVLKWSYVYGYYLPEQAVAR